MSARKRGRRSDASVSAPVTPSAPAAPLQQFLHVVKNLLGQALTISLVNDAGDEVREQVPAHGLSRAVKLDRITPYTKGLVDRGYARIINAPQR